MNEDLDFGKILQDAEHLTAQIETSTDLPRVQRNLRQITEAGRLLRERALRDENLAHAETKASMFLGSKGIDISQLSKHLEPVSLAATAHEPGEVSLGVDSDIEIHLKTERSNAICAIAEMSMKSAIADAQASIEKRLNLEWKIEKERLMASLSATTEPPDYQRTLYDHKIEPSVILSKAELTYTHEIDQYNRAIINNLPKPNLLERMDLAAKNSGDKNVQDLWAIISALVTTLPFDSNPSALERRSNSRFNKALISRAKQYLEKTQLTRLQAEVWKTLGKARAGAGTFITLLKHYIEVKSISVIPGLEVGAADIGPVWVIIYFCLRTGKVEEAVNYVRNTVGNSEFAAVLEEYGKCEPGEGLPKDMDGRLKVEYHKIQKLSSSDPFKSLVYCILGAVDVENDHPEIANRLDDYLWLKLSQVREEDALNTPVKRDILTFADLQALILETYGESHFDAFKQPYTYFQALVLTGQFEAGLEFMSRINGLRSHAVHAAIVLNEMNLLITCDPKSPAIVRVNDDPPGLRRLNFANLIIRHAKSFQGTNTKEALNYFYFLRNIKNEEGASLFSVSVSSLAVESREYALLFGAMNSDGCRTPGVLETMGLELVPLIEFCGDEAEKRGRFDDASILFDLAGKYDRALKPLIHLLSSRVTQKPLQDSSRQHIQKIALSLAERYQNTPTNADKFALTTFYLLVDLMTFFDEFHAQRIESALVIIEKMKVLPMDKNDLERCVSNFHSYANEIRMNIPDLLLATIELLFTKFKSVKEEKNAAAGDVATSALQVMADLRSRAKNLVTYCGLIPYYMNSEIYTKVMQIEVMMN